ncbi:hypothetical protein COW80_02750 [Candidatus Beckwithbacteria bacterium CG22_combo_CG10-13_8_21_14_all_01_47_9]|uniref:Uncharacterized protein n=1 Tax=Candidatus Beckwithbacteria bacterium CG22_combo_CG10-13_8_21_14_all_01_47_9 TaxID=1974496 RepID=A0A2H0E2G9_9BACT|nr:MAG: hypothetical protein COW80_02750 [Candidatus Beckwithbacteria bacterium CG22_combo_CG10-13_8_21_14_all_01_47_9]
MGPNLLRVEYAQPMAVAVALRIPLVAPLPLLPFQLQFLQLVLGLVLPFAQILLSLFGKINNLQGSFLIFC